MCISALEPSPRNKQTLASFYRHARGLCRARKIRVSIPTTMYRDMGSPPAKYNFDRELANRTYCHCTFAASLLLESTIAIKATCDRGSLPCVPTGRLGLSFSELILNLTR